MVAESGLGGRPPPPSPLKHPSEAAVAPDEQTPLLPGRKSAATGRGTSGAGIPARSPPALSSRGNHHHTNDNGDEVEEDDRDRHNNHRDDVNGIPSGEAVAAAAAAATSADGPPRAPLAIAHRGFSAAAPENTLLAFRLAAAAGAAALETDVRLSRDGVVVLSHDATLRRCFGVDGRVRDRDWAELAELTTIRTPTQPMARLRDLLTWLVDEEQEGQEGQGKSRLWVMLDIKNGDDAEELVRGIAATLASVPPGARPWSERIMPCCWNAQYIKLCMQYLPGYPLANVGLTAMYSRALADRVPNLSISMLRFTLATPIVGPRFARKMRQSGHPVYIWTVNGEDWMEWCARGGFLDGVITDDPKLFLEVCRRVAEGKTAAEAAEDRGEAKLGSRMEAWRRRHLSVEAVVKRARRCYEWAFYYGALVLVTVTFFFTQGLPSTQVRKILG
ncbi:PLC-like phosphodiesterase [Durotheca rogersii]|uniref:PLC-like phosphodiesterase n=1 Tax=Durotheca rogersii TaxID=419775 RepID=UPI00221E492D|nr:PLC-like phosphodiesterase [Durotheca rogersii]KAI5860151.1 PLC-like phosphodiesterase [Durotheca rogersii]